MANSKEILMHGKNYMIASLATRALAFISIPVYTRLLSPEDYGITAVFLAMIAILNSLLALNFDTSISRYYFDRASDNDFKEFIGTTLIASFFIMLPMSALIIINVHQIADFLNLPFNVVYLFVPMVIINIIGLFFAQIYQPQKLSKPIAISSLSRVYLGFLCSVGLIFVFKSEKYLGQILGQILAGGAMLIYWFRKISPFIELSFNKKHLKYILNYSVPLIPYVLSGVIIEQFGKLTIASNDGLSQVGFYTLAVSIASLTGIITEITHQAWYPYYMEYMKTKEYAQHDKDLVRIFKISLLAAMFFSCFGQEIGLILAKREFTSALYLVPILTIGYVFHQVSYAYMRNISFALKTSYMSVIVISSGCINILLNSLLIPKLGIIGSAFSFVMSYIVMAILAWFVSTYVIRIRGIAIMKLFKPFIWLILFFIPLYFVFQLSDFFFSFISKLVLLGGLTYILLRKERHLIMSFLLRFIRR